MELLLGILMIIGTYCLCKKDEWKANNHTPPPGYRIDYGKQNYDYVMHGKDYVNKKTIQGGYDVPIKNPKIGI